jgi:hypothetical protein
MNLASQALRLWEDRRVRLAVAALAFAGLTAITYLIAHPRMFTGFMGYDDEGYMLTALKAFVNHGHLYDEVFTQYGPFYYEAWGGLFSLFGIPVDHDAGRMATMLAWIVSSLAIGLAAMRMTRSLLLGLGTQALVFTALGVATNEPMHPGGIICLLLAAIVVIACFVSDRPSPYALAVLGGAVAALILVKINVGFFALGSLALAAVVSYPLLSDRRWPRWLVEAGFVALPLVLMAGKLDQGWARQYALHVAAAALAVVIVLRARENRRRADEELAWLLGGLVVVAILVCVAIVGAGTSLDGLVEGVLRQPLRQADAFTIPLALSKRAYGLDLIALAAVAAFWYASRRGSGPAGRAWQATVSLFSLAVGLAMALSVTGKLLPFDPTGFPGYWMSMLAFAWVALIPAAGGEPRNASFARLLLPLLAVLQALHAYPVAGSQSLWASFLLIPVGAICVGNGARGLYAALGERSERRAAVGFACAAVVVLGWFVLNGSLKEQLRGARGAYNDSRVLQLPGAEEIHLGDPENQTYTEITTAIDDNCPALVMLPGMDSFYLWTEQEPPTFTATGWPTLFDDERQREAIADIEGIEGLCLLRNIPIAAGWGGGEIPPGPLVSYLERGFEPLASWGDYELLQRPPGAAS